MACAGDDVGCVAGEAGAGAMEGDAVVVADERRMLAAIVRLQPPHVILFWFLGCSRRVRADADTPATV